MAVEVNVVGDFCVSKNLSSLRIGERLSGCLSEADVNVVNMEGPIACANPHLIQKSGPCIVQNENVPTFLSDKGFNVVTLANNHIMDLGETGCFQTKKAFKDTLLLGCGTWEEAYSVKYEEVNGVRLGFLALTQHEFGVLDDNSYACKKTGTAWLLHPCIDELILKAKKQCDFLLMLPHAGLEHFCYPLPELRTLYRHFIRMGADAIVGAHPHVPQCWEIFEGKPIVYSVGNFCFNALPSTDKFWYYGLMASLLFDNNSVALKVLAVHFDEERNVIDVDGDDELMSHLDLINSVFKNEGEYINEVEKQCASIAYMYNLWFEKSGYIRPEIVKYIKHIFLRLKCKYRKQEMSFDESYMINNLRCEPHRWVLSRLYEMKNKK